MSVEVLFAEKYWDLELGEGGVRCDCDENGVLPTSVIDPEKGLKNWYSIQNGYWKKTILVSPPCSCDDLEFHLDLNLLLSGNHRMEVGVLVNKTHTHASSETLNGTSRVSIYQSRVVKTLQEGSFEGQVYVNIDPLVIRKAQLLELSIELRSEQTVSEEDVANLMIELHTMGKRTRLWYQLLNLSSTLALQA